MSDDRLIVALDVPNIIAGMDLVNNIHARNYVWNI